jgi:hypothetical protein
VSPQHYRPQSPTHTSAEISRLEGVFGELPAE